MNQFLTLLKREHLEHKNAFFWAPVVILALIIIAGLSAGPRINDLRIEMTESTGSDGHSQSQGRWQRSDGDARSERRAGQQDRGVIDGELDDEFSDVEDGHTAAMGVMGLDVAGRTDAELQARLQPAMRAVAMPFFWVLFIVTLFGCLACLHDERKDRSILFWKSMPVSDTSSVLSKYIYLAWVAPLATLAAIFISQLYSLSVLSMIVEDGMASRVWSNSGLVSGAGHIIFGFLLNGFAVLPIFGWLMLVSVWSKSVPFVWALGVPIGLSVLEGIVLGSSFVKSTVVFHGKLPALPRIGAGENGQAVDVFAQQLALLAHPQFYVGIVLGALFIAATVYLRRRNNEI
jgi:hypothetical protein